MSQVELVSTMGTVVSLDVRTPAPREAVVDAVEAVSARLQQIDDVFSAWQPESWVSRLIRGTVAPQDCPPEVGEVIDLALVVMRATDGYFSPYWRRRPCGDPGPDPTGLVKGWAAQQASEVLLQHGLVDHVVNAAGDVVVSGCSDTAAAALSWHVGISDPHRARALLGFVDLDRRSSRWAVATSGTAEHGTHVCDPLTGLFPATVVSATVVAPLADVTDGGAVADAWATALVASGEHAPVLLERLTTEGMTGFLVGPDRVVVDPQRLLLRA